jgi:predicted GH43/DUF377 family glycosyl hydrolase
LSFNQIAFNYNYNPAYLQLADGTHAMLVRIQNQRNTSEFYSTTQSIMGLSTQLHANNLTAWSTIQTHDIVFRPDGSAAENFGTEDPRVVQHAGVTHLFYSAVEQQGGAGSGGVITSRLSRATTSTPRVAASWRRHGPIVRNGANGTFGWSKSGALLLRNSPAEPSFLIFGDSSLLPGIQLAKTTDLLTYDIISNFIFLGTRAQRFDSALVESGPPPLQLSTGDWFFVYNSARHVGPSAKPGYALEYNAGYAIISGTDPTKVLFRSEEPILSPVLGWERGTAPWPRLTPRVVFIEGMRRKSGGSAALDLKALAKLSKVEQRAAANTFVVYYGAADSTVGTATITVAL